MDLVDPITTISGIGPIVASRLDKLGIKTIFDFLYHLPFRYEDRRKISKIKGVQPGETVTVVGRIEEIKGAYTKRGKTMQSGIVHDDSGKIKLLWFNQPYLTRALQEGKMYSFYGKVQFFARSLVIIAPEFELIDIPLSEGSIVSVYPETAGLTSKWIRSKMKNLLMQINFSDFLPGGKVIPWKQSLEALHFPKQLEGLEQYKQRLALDELVLLHLTAMIHKQKWQNTKLAHAFKVDFVPVDKFISSLSFTLTVSQRRSINEIASDLSKKQAMNRLLQGDVGSGKTIVAATAAYISYLNNFQTLVLAPTQILADQHLQTFTNIFKNTDVKLGHVTGAIKNYSPDSNIIIGTHALLSKNIDFTKVGLVIIDEQHRFGVAQRGLAAAKGQTPHVLTMTATPIPRTIALTLFSDLDLSVLDELPQGRKTVKTWVVPESKRSSAYSWVKKQLTEQNSQCFWVCPLINESETLADVKSVTHEFEQVKNIFSDLKVGLLHGRMPAKQKTETLKLMQDKKIDILVCTPVVEVGIDIPNATIMAIETAERFGLAQLHQLRGRVGRGDKSSYCLLFSTKPTPRLQAMETHYSGMKLAEIDMQMRGAGDILGTSQHGLPSFKVANYTDTVAIAQAQKLAKELILDLPNLPLLRSLVEKDKIGLVQPN